MNNKNNLHDFHTLLRARNRAMLISTFEEGRLEQDIVLMSIEMNDVEVYSYSVTSGLSVKEYSVQIDNRVKVSERKIKDLTPNQLIDFISDFEKNNKKTNSSIAIFLIKDIHDLWTNPSVKRKIRDFLESSRKNSKNSDGTISPYTPLVFISPIVEIPLELERLVQVVDYSVPTREEVSHQLSLIEKTLLDKNIPTGLSTKRDREAAINALVGMTHVEIYNVLAKTTTENGFINIDDIIKEKEQIIKKTGILEYITDLGNMSNVGGLDNLKDWLDNARYSFDHEAIDYKVDTTRGLIITGFPGTGKTLTAKSIAYNWNLPLLKMNMNDILDSHVGKSEQNMAKALKLAESISPCILFIDEMEKALAGGNGGESDGGTSTRMMNILLTWLSDKKKPVFVIGTANDITGLRPELTRAGRFDEIFFASVPSQNERCDILKIHLSKRGYNIVKDNEEATEPNEFTPKQISEVASHMKDFTGAEIEQVVSNAGRVAYAQYRKGLSETHYIKQDELILGAKKLVPLSKRTPHLLTDLREWAKTSAKFASSEEEKLVCDEGDVFEDVTFSYEDTLSKKGSFNSESLFE